MEKPNVLLLTIDTLRTDRVGAYGRVAGLTPHLDRLAAMGMRFDQAITGGSWTQAAFPVLLTSSSASYYGGCLGPLAAGRPSPIEALANHGYHTAGFTTSPLLGDKYGYQRGFQDFVQLTPDDSDPVIRRFKGGERLLRHSVTHYAARLLGQDFRPPRLYVDGAELTDALTGWIGEATQPFFAWAHYMDVHWPYHLEETLGSASARAAAWSDMAHLYRVNRRGERMLPAQKERYIRLYEEAVRHLDRHIGRLLSSLEQQGLLDNTIILAVADHGEEFMERRHWGHFEVNLYDEIIRVPFIAYVPGERAGQVISRQVRLLDVMPTVLDMCRCPVPEGVEGRSLVPLWRSDRGEYESEIAVSEMWRDHRHIVALRTLAHKYVWDSRHPEAPRLYDLEQDPEERQNLFGRLPDVEARFQAALAEHRRRGEATLSMETGAPPELDDALLQRLADLGYVDG